MVRTARTTNREGEPPSAPPQNRSVRASMANASTVPSKEQATEVPVAVSENPSARREFARILRVQTRLVRALERVKEDLEDTRARDLHKEIRRRTGEPAPEEWSDALASVEEAIRSLNLYGAEVESKLDQEPTLTTLEGIENLPSGIARFLAERKRTPGFQCEVRTDPDRGWIISWREYTSTGELRAFGQLPERPWAWLDE